MNGKKCDELPTTFKGIVGVIFVVAVAVEDDGFSRICCAVSAVLNVCERAFYDMRNEKTVIIGTDQMVSLHAVKVSRADGMKMKFFRSLRG